MVSKVVVNAAVAAYFQALTSLDVERYVGVFAPDAVVHNPPGAPPQVGVEAIRQSAQRLFGAYRAIWPTMERICIAGNGAAVLYTAHFTTLDGETTTGSGIDVFEVTDAGLIQVIRYY